MWDPRCGISCDHRQNNDRGSKEVTFSNNIHNNLIVLTGPESTGKTTLSALLSEHFNVPSIPEFAREYIQHLDREYEIEDLTKIAIGQNELLQEGLKARTVPLIMDTDLMTVQIWSQYKYGKVDEEISGLLRNNLPALYLFCDIDMPWVEDEQRENPNDRKILRNLYLQQIALLGIPHVIIRGDYPQRFSLAVEAIARVSA